MSRGRVAVVGSGIAGLSAAWSLAGAAEAPAVTLFEAGSHFGGHTHTVDVTLPDRQGRPQAFGVDTGFLVYNERTYPQLIALLDTLGVETAPSDMSFSVRVPDGHGPGRALEWNGSDLNTVFAQRGNLLRPRFWAMLREILRFNRVCTALAESGEVQALEQPLGDFLEAHCFGEALRRWYLLPMLGCIWSCPTDQMLRFPVATMIRFCHHHGLIQVNGRPAWRTVRGGARHYVQRMLELLPDARLGLGVERVQRLEHGVRLWTRRGPEDFDQLILACHSDQALALLEAPSPAEQAVLGAIRYHGNRAVLHTDADQLPAQRRAWAAWNYEHAAQGDREGAAVCLHYLLNKLQPLPVETPLIVSLNPVREPRGVLREIDYAHPVFDLAAIRAQARLPGLQGRQRTWFAGAWAGYGFHEDGLKSGLAAAAGVLAALRQPGHAADAARRAA